MAGQAREELSDARQSKHRRLMGAYGPAILSLAKLMPMTGSLVAPAPFSVVVESLLLLLFLLV